jgi:succinate dehydrogenase / fumarate reductase flavoprotein subunit
VRNGKGERFMFNAKYTPPAYKGRFAETEEEAARWLEDKDNNRPPPELLPRDVVARAIYREVLEGNGTEHGGVHLDVTHRGAEFIKRKLPSMYEQFHALGDVDITREPMEVYPTIHYTMGGVKAEPESCATNVPGLYAAGETAAGVHGANRLGGNALCDLLVFGKRAGEAAAQYAQGMGHGTIDEAELREEAASLLAPFESPGKENPYLLSQELQEAMQEGAMIARTEEGLQKCLDRVVQLQGRARDLHIEGSRLYNPGWHTARDVQNMLKVSEIIVRCALERRESRGAQWRLDYPDPDPEWGKVMLIATRDGEEVKIGTSPVEEMPAELAGLFEGKK